MAKITGTLLDDTIVGGYGISDSLNGAAGNDVLYGYGDGSGIGGSVPPYLPDAGGPKDNDTLSGALGADTLFGGGGNDKLDGGAGADSMDGGDQDDVYYVDNAGDVAAESNADAFGGTDLVISSVDHDLGNGIENLTLTGKATTANGNALSNAILGNALDNALGGGGGNDTIDGGAGADFMGGGAGDDTYIIDNAGDSIFEFGGDGTDTVRWMRNVNLDLSAFSNIENGVLLGSASISLTGTAGNNGLGGNTGNNVIDGGGGDDTMAGGGGNDTYMVDGGDYIYEAAGGGTDLVISSADFYLSNAQNVEQLTLTGTAIQADGNDLANVIRGNDMNNFIDGLGGGDTMIGGNGDDSYYVDTAGDKIVELTGGGTDSVTSYISYTLPAEVEVLYLSSIYGANLSGTGNAANNKLVGTDGSNILDGKAGADTMDGGNGSDAYHVDDIGDVESDSGGNGIDQVYASVSHLIGNGIENLTLTGKAAIGSGNNLNNNITGNAGDNLLNGYEGGDGLNGGAGKDILNGGGGYDRLDGGAGADTMDGGKDSDIYIVDNVGDKAEEADDSSFGDIVESSVTYTLHSSMDILYLTGKAAINGTGNDDLNYIYGNGAANKLAGLGGQDVLEGGAGNDTLDAGTADGAVDTLRGGVGNDVYIVSTSDEVAIEDLAGAAGGIDTVQAFNAYALGANLENLTLVGAALDGYGNALKNVLIGNDLNNNLYGLGGADTMSGGKGDDTYGVDSVGDVVKESAGGGHDTVVSSISYALAMEVENLELDSSAGPGLKGTGNGLANSLVGGAGDDTLNGVGGADTMFGGDGSDTLIVDNIGDVTSDEFAFFDRVLSSVSHTIGDGVDNLTLTGTANINGMGNALSNVIEGNSGKNVLSGLGGADFLSGGGGNDSLLGGEGGDGLLGGAGLDTLDGGAGSDRYIFDISSSGKDTILSFETGPGGDVLDLSELLVGYAEGVSSPNDFVRINFINGDMVLQVDVNGLAGGSKFTDLAVLASYPDATIDQLMAGGNLQLAQTI